VQHDYASLYGAGLPNLDDFSPGERSQTFGVGHMGSRGSLRPPESSSYEPPRAQGRQDPSNPARRNADVWDSDDEDDFAEMDYRRHSQFLSEQDEERVMAAMRGAIAAGKKIPSKEALASLEKVDLKDLKDADKSRWFSFASFEIHMIQGSRPFPQDVQYYPRHSRLAQ
jgi:hypothetical protein